jgi:hypothetical protein
MYRTRFAFIFFAIAAMIFASSSHLFAQQTRTWVSGGGSDTSACTYTSPCATFAGALAKTSPGGVISVLAPGDFQPVTISQSVTIDGSGTYAGILVSSTGITVAAGASDTVVIRGLHIDGASAGQIGVDFQSGGSLYVEQCTISNLMAYGISFGPTGAGQLFVTDTTIGNINPASSSTAAIYLTASGKSTVTIDKTRLEGAGIGLLTKSPNIKALVSNSVISGNSNQGIYVLGSSMVSTTNCIVGNNAKTAVLVNAAGAQVLISNDAIVNCGAGLGVAAGSIISTRTNAVTQDSGKPGVPTSTVALE